PSLLGRPSCRVGLVAEPFRLCLHLVAFGPQSCHLGLRVSQSCLPLPLPLGEQLLLALLDLSGRLPEPTLGLLLGLPEPRRALLRHLGARHATLLLDLRSRDGDGPLGLLEETLGLLLGLPEPHGALLRHLG